MTKPSTSTIPPDALTLRERRIAEQNLAQKRIDDLEALASRLGLRVANGAELCVRRLSIARHRCNSNKCYQSEESGGYRYPNLAVFDHLRWLRDPDSGTWTLLCQPYQYDPDALTQWCSTHGFQWRELDGPAPHGFSTHTVIITGI